MAVYSLTGNDSSPFHAEPAHSHDLVAVAILRLRRSILLMGMSPVSELLARSSSLGRSQIPPWVVELRPHHWLKNILVIVPLAAAHQLQDVPSLARVAAAFVAFSLCASGQYVLNDLLDLASDRTHSTKSKRPLAAGTLSRGAGVILMALAWTGAVLAAATLGAAFCGVLGAYLALMAYS
jgi:hypothetical protein